MKKSLSQLRDRLKLDLGASTSVANWIVFLMGLCTLRLLAGLVHVVFPLTKPHLWRQVDTMAVAYRYSQRWKGLGVEGLEWWFPAVLNSSDSSGLMAMEFPLLNMVSALGFLIGGDDIALGRSLAQASFLLLLVMSFVFAAWSAYRFDLRVKGSHVSAIFFAFCCSFSTPFTAKFLPDLVAMFFVVGGVFLISNEMHWRFKSFGLIAISVGVLMKPTALAGIFIWPFLSFENYLLDPRHWFKTSMCHLLWFSAAGVAPGIYYLKVLPWIQSQMTRTPLFNLHHDINPAEALLGFWSSAGIWDVLHFHLVFPFGRILLTVPLVRGRADFSHRQKSKLVILVASILAGLSFIGLLSGTHATYHAYYLVGISPLVGILLLELWKHSHLVWWRWVLMLGLFSRTIEASVADLGHAIDAWKKTPSSVYALLKDCEDLRQEVHAAPWGEGVEWRTPREEYPLIDLCIGERGQSTKGEWGVFRITEEIPSGCQAVSEKRELRLFRCDSVKT